MALIIPNIESITNGSNGYDFQAVPDATDWAIQQAADSGSFVISGMAVTWSSAFTISIASGVYTVNGIQYTYAGGTTTVTGASVTDRRDLVSIDTSGTVHVTAGTACGTAGWTRVANTTLPPIKPAIPANQCPLAEVGVPGGASALAAINVVDKTNIVANSFAAGALGVDYTCTGSLATYLTSASLSIGTWEINWQVCAYHVSGADQCGLQISAGTATASFQGPVTMESRNDSATGPFAAMNHCTTIAVITGAGTLVMQAIGLETNKPLIKASAPSGGTVGSPTGYVAVRRQ